MTQPIPEGFHSLTPHVVVRGAADAIEFYKRAFGAEEVCRMNGPDGESVMHCELQIGSSRMMLADEWPGDPTFGSPATVGGTAVCMHIYCDDADALYERATQAGAEPTMPMMDAFWGDRYGQVKDPFGHRWSIATHTKDVTPEEMAAAAEAFFSGGGCEQEMPG